MDCGEVRKVNIIYFLSRDGKVEQPHLIQVYHLHRHGVRLHDVKRWMSDLRGKGMPDYYAWSYKRRYKKGFVWEDLMTEEALITPVADNEYVLKGSYILETLPPKEHHHHHHHLSPNLGQRGQFHTDLAPNLDAELGLEASQEEKRGTKGDKPSSPETEEPTPVPVPVPETIAVDYDEVSPKPPPPLDQNSPERDDCLDEEEEEMRRRRVREPAAAPAMGRSGRASHVLRSILTCRVGDADDSALILIRNSQNYSRVKPEHDNGNAGSYARRSWSRDSGRKKKTGEERAATAAQKYRAVAAPYCSQCGKTFKPEKLHAHMKSCKALRGRGRRSRKNLEKLPLRMETQMEEFSAQSAPSFLLTLQ